MLDIGLKKEFKLAVRKGHNEVVRGASALIDEVNENTKVLKELLDIASKIKNLKVLDCSSSTKQNTVNGDLRYGVDKANNWNADMFVSIHFNKAYKTYDGNIGTEVLVYGTANKRHKNIQSNLVKLGFKNRGCKAMPKLYELRSTSMDSAIVEVCFVEATGDVATYKNVGPRAVAKAILEGILNHSIDDNNTSTSKPSTSKPSTSKPSTSKPKKETWENYIVGDQVKKLQKELNVQFKANISVDGYFGDKTIASLVVVKKGAKGNLTKIIQERLTAKKYNVGRTGSDGIFGADTERAVKEIQKVNKLTIDGIVGVNTWKVLYKK